MENRLIRDPLWVPALKALGVAAGIAAVVLVVWYGLLAMAHPVYAEGLGLTRTHPNHMSGTGGGGSSSRSSGYITRQVDCNKSTYIVKKYLDEELVPVRDPDARKWCQFFHSNTCNLPTVAFVPDRKEPQYASRRDNRQNHTLQYSLKWYQSSTAEVFVMYPGYSGCRIYERKGGPKFRGGPKKDEAQAEKPESGG